MNDTMVEFSGNGHSMPHSKPYFIRFYLAKYGSPACEKSSSITTAGTGGGMR
jgi:hypothetical protein